MLRKGFEILHKFWETIRLGKHGPSTAFRRHLQSSPDDGGEERIFQVEHQTQSCHGSVTAPNSVELETSDPPEGRDGDKQPPSSRSRPNRVPSPQAEGLPSSASLAKICLFAGAQVCLVASLIRYNIGTSLSSDAKILLFRAKLLGFAGFLFCLGAYIVQRSRRASRLLTAIGCVATICGFLSILVVNLGIAIS